MVSVLVLVLVTAAHTLHSSLATVTWRSETGTLELAVRAFTQDLEGALARRDGSPCAYVQAALTLRDAAGELVPTTRCTVERQGDVSWVRFATAPGDPRAWRLSNSLLFELFRDQINIVQLSIPGRTRTLLFTRGDGPKPLT